LKNRRQREKDAATARANEQADAPRRADEDQRQRENDAAAWQAFWQNPASEAPRRADEDQRQRENDAAEFRRNRDDEHRSEAKRRADEDRPHPSKPIRVTDPHAVLGLSRSATRDQIKTAYRVLIAQYHPDKVAQLGPELQHLATEKTKDINDAYRTLMSGGKTERVH
jgi:hypothetical protein